MEVSRISTIKEKVKEYIGVINNGDNQLTIMNYLDIEFVLCHLNKIDLVNGECSRGSKSLDGEGSAHRLFHR